MEKKTVIFQRSPCQLICGTSQHPLQISPRLDQLRSKGLDHCCLCKKTVIQKGWIWMVAFQELSCKFLGVYHLRWIHVTWVCFLLFFFVCVCTPWKIIGLNPTMEQQWRFGSIAWFLVSMLIFRSVTLIDLPEKSYQQHVSQIHLLSGQTATEMIVKSRGLWYSYWVGPSLPPIAHARKRWK